MQKIAQGQLRKMASSLASPIHYHLVLNEEQLALNDYLGKTINLQYTGQIFCIQCGRKTNKSFQQGYCYPCMQRLAECNFCIIHPQKCHHTQETCSNDDWAHSHCLVPHMVYLANSTGLKVGITHNLHSPTRWIDQGASQALPIFMVNNRYQSGIIEVALKSFVSDRTNWRKLLTQQAEPIDLIAERNRLLTIAEEKIKSIMNQFSNDIKMVAEIEVLELQYPILTYPDKLKTLSFDDNHSITGQLLGIKGQYLILDCGVINIRKFSGYEINFF